MRAPLLFAVLIGCFASSVWGQQDERIRVLASGVADLNGRIVASGAERSREFSNQRATLLSELIALDPGRALTLALPEEMAEWSGSLTGIVYDDFENKRSSTAWRLLTADGEFEAYFAGASPRGGSTATVRGLRAGQRLAVSELLAGSSAAASYSPLGDQTIAVLLVTMPSYPALPAWSSAAFHEEVFFGQPTGSAATESLKGYWERVSNGAATASGRVFGPVALSQDYTCSQAQDLARAAVKAFDPAVDLTRFAHLAIMFPVSSCFYAGMSTLGASTIESPSKGNFTASLTWFPTAGDAPSTTFRTIVAHELGHGLGLDHARSADYGAVPLDAIDHPAARVDEYGDWFSAMGNPWYAFGYYSAAEQLRLGWLKRSEYYDVASEGTFVLRPLESSGQPRALRVLRNAEGGDWLWFEHRQPVGVDNSLYGIYRSFVMFGSTDWVTREATVFRGALVRHEISDGRTYLLDFRPLATPNDFTDAALEGGRSWSDPFSPVTINVGEPTLDGLPVTVKYDQPCASPRLSAQSFDANGGEAYIDISAPASCEWAALTNSDWISIDGPTSGRGSGAVRFRVSQNTGSRRTGYIAIGRQSAAVAQAGAFPTALSVTPSSGEGASARFTFAFSQPAGTPMATAVLRFTGSGLCQMIVDVPNRLITLLGNDGTSYLPWIPVGTSGLRNAVCAIGGSSVTLMSGRVSIAVDVAFTAAGAGAYTISAAPYDWVTLGTWMVSRPAVPSLTIAATAPGAPFQVDGGNVYHAPATFNWEPGERHTVKWLGTSPDHSALSYSFVAWVDGGENPRVLTATSGQDTYTANISVSGAGYIVQTIAGGQFTPAAAPALAAPLSEPYGVAVDNAGNTFVSCPWENLVYRIDSEGVITRFAGSGAAGLSGDGGPAIHAKLYHPHGLAVDRKGNLLIADRENARIRRVSPDGTISTVAGVGCCGPWGDGGPAIEAGLSYPVSVAAGPDGGFYIWDDSGLRRVDAAGTIWKPSAPPDLSQFGRHPQIAADAAGTVYFASGTGLWRLAADGTLSRRYEGYLNAVSASLAGEIYFADSYRIYRLTAREPEVVGGTVFNGSTADGVAALSAEIRPSRIAADAADYITYLDSAGKMLRKFRQGGLITTIAGYDSSDAAYAIATTLNQPMGLATDPKGRLYFSDAFSNRIRRMSADGAVSTIAGTGVRGVTGDGGKAIDVRLSEPTSLAIDNQSNLYFSEQGSSSVRKIDANGMLSTVYYRQNSCPHSVALDGIGRLYVTDPCARIVSRVEASGEVTTIAGNGSYGSSGDGGPGINASFKYPKAIAVDRKANVYITDDCRIRKLTPDGLISTFLATNSCAPSASKELDMGVLSGLAIDGADNVYVGDEYQKVTRITPAGEMEIILGVYGWQWYGDGAHTGDGGPAKYATTRSPNALAFDNTGNLYIAESGNQAIRKLTPSGVDPVLTVSVTHERPFTGATGEYSIKVTNALFAAATRGAVTVTEYLPEGLRLRAMYGDGWSCTGNSCTRNDTLSGGSYPRITVAVDISEDAPTQVTNQVIVTGGGAPAAGAQDFTEVGAPPSITAEGVVNAASYVRGAATGGLVSIFGKDLVRGMSGVQGASGSPLPLQLGGTTVTLGDRVLPILAVASFDGLDQINVQMPYGLGGQSLPLRVSSGGLSGDSIDLPVSHAQPGIFMVSSDVPAVVHSTDYSLVTPANPAKPGEFVAVYCTGLGQVSPPVKEGIAAPASPLSWTASETAATIGGVRADIQFSGLAPGFTGLYQVNVRIPEGTASGPASLVISTSGASSQTVPLAIR